MKAKKNDLHEEKAFGNEMEQSAKEEKAAAETPAEENGADGEAAAEASAAEEAPAQDETDENVTLKREEFEQVRKHIETLQKEKDETVALCQRLQADFENYRKRNASLHLDSVNEGERNVIKALLPVIDNFDRAMDNSENIDPAWLEGIKLVQRQFLDTLSRLGLTQIDTSGKFDPAVHEAVMQQESDSAESGDIVMVMQKGYKVKDKIIRCSMVGVAK